jgi:hypothetical protein
MVTGSYPDSVDVHLQLREMGFYDLIGVDGIEDVPDLRDREGRPYFVRFRSFLGVNGSLPQVFAIWFLRMLFR